MPPKSITDKSSTYGTSDDTIVSPRLVSLSLLLEGQTPGPGEFLFLAIFNGQIVLDSKWQNELLLESEALALNLKEPRWRDIAADKPLILLLRAVGGKGAKDPDPLLNLDNRAGATVDLFPLVLGEEEIFISVPLVDITTGQNFGCTVEVQARSSNPIPDFRIPLLLTFVSAHCLPLTKEGTVYVGAIGLDDVLESKAVNFGMSLSSNEAKKVVWATASNGGQATNTALNVPDEDMFMPQDLELNKTTSCNSVYWNAMKRVMVDPLLLQSRASSPFFIEIAGVPKIGKIEVRGRYMGFIDAAALLEPGQFGVTTCNKLLFYNEAELPENVGPLLELPPVSAKISARDSDLPRDEYGHNSYIVIRFDLATPLVPKAKIASLFETIGFPPPEKATAAETELYVEPPPEDTTVDVRKIRKEAGALAVHKELSSLACRGAVPMNKSIKRTAANRLLVRVRSMLKQFPACDCSYLEWQDTVTAQHAASRRAVTYSFAPQPPPPRPPATTAAARCRLAGDTKIANHYLDTDLLVSTHEPRSLLAKALQCLEARVESEAKKYLLEGLSVQTRNKFLLWTYGAQQFDRGAEACEMAEAAFRIAVKGDNSDGTSNAIGWAAIHTIYHFNDKHYAAFIAAKKMRKSYELLREWKKFLKRWGETSGQEEILWIPSVVSSRNPMIIAAAFFLCLRCYNFCEKILKCVEYGCAERGSRLGLRSEISPDIYYIRAASHLLRRQFDKALEVTRNGVKKFGPSAKLSQMQTSCLLCINGWDGECEASFQEAERAGAVQCPALLLQGALACFRVNPKTSLQRAARCHKLAPNAYSALVIGRIYELMGQASMAERWASAAVKTEPHLADGWAVLAILAMQERNVDKARTMIRTANQVGIVSPDIKQQMQKMISTIRMQELPDALLEDLCLCEYCSS